MVVSRAIPRYWTGEEIRKADEVEVFYPDLHGIPHRGIVYGFQVGPMGAIGIDVIHNSKRNGGVGFISFADFAQSSLVNLRRRAQSSQHADAISARLRAPSTIPTTGGWRTANI